MINTYGRINTAFGEQGDHVPNLNPEQWGKDKDDRVEGNPAAATPPSGSPNAENILAEAPAEEPAVDAEGALEPEADGDAPEADLEAEADGEAQGEVEPDPEVTEVDYEALTIPELKTELDAREIEYKSSDNKPELIELLVADDTTVTPSDEA